MTALEKRWLLRILDAILPAGADPRLPGARELPLRGLIDDLDAAAPWTMRFALRAATWIVTWLGPALTGRPRTFGMLDVAERGRVLDELSRSRVYLIRELPLLLKMVGCLGYAALPRVQRAVGLTSVDAEPPAWAREAA